MCRWMAWSGQPVLMDELLLKTQHGLIDQSLHSRLGVETTNRDGFGVGWYGAGKGPACITASPRPGGTRTCASSPHTSRRRSLSHVRATTGTAVQETNCHPFRHGRWLFVHNGVLAGFHGMRRDLMLAVDPDLFADFHGSTDSEVIFRLALTFGLEQDPVGALERAIGLVEATAKRHGIENAVQASMGLSDGVRVWAFRYSTEGHSRTLFVSADAASVRRLHPETRAGSGCATRIASWSPSRSPSSPVCGRRSLRRACSWSRRGADELLPFRPHVGEGDVNGAQPLDALRA